MNIDTDDLFNLVEEARQANIQTGQLLARSLGDALAEHIDALRDVSTELHALPALLRQRDEYWLSVMERMECVISQQAAAITSAVSELAAARRILGADTDARASGPAARGNGRAASQQDALL